MQSFIIILHRLILNEKSKVASETKPKIELCYFLILRLLTKDKFDFRGVLIFIHRFMNHTITKLVSSRNTKCILNNTILIIVRFSQQM